MTVLLVSLGTSQQCIAKKEEETYFITFVRHYEISTTICWNSLFFPKNSKTNLVIAKIHINTFMSLRLIGIFVSNAFFWYTDIGIHISLYMLYICLSNSCLLHEMGFTSFNLYVWIFFAMMNTQHLMKERTKKLFPYSKHGSDLIHL